jgi:NADH:ubiquinone oxidoreductase subunit C
VLLYYFVFINSDKMPHHLDNLIELIQALEKENKQLKDHVIHHQEQARAFQQLATVRLVELTNVDIQMAAKCARNQKLEIAHRLCLESLSKTLDEIERVYKIISMRERREVELSLIMSNEEKEKCNAIIESLWNPSYFTKLSTGMDILEEPKQDPVSVADVSV